MARMAAHASGDRKAPAIQIARTTSRIANTARAFVRARASSGSGSRPGPRAGSVVDLVFRWFSIDVLMAAAWSYPDGATSVGNTGPALAFPQPANHLCSQRGNPSRG